MIGPETPPDETHRLEALQALFLLDTEPEDDFDAVVRLGQRLLGVPTCLVTLVDGERQWFKARAGLDATETPRAVSFCGHAILQGGPFVVLDASKDPRFHDNPLVTGPPFIRFYAGMPLTLPSGYRIGTVCALSPEPRTRLDDAGLQALAALADQALTAVTVRALRRELDRTRIDADRFRGALSFLPIPVAFTDADGTIETCNDAFVAWCGVDMPEGRPAREVLPLGGWSPAAMTAGEQVLALPNDRGALRIQRDVRGFVLIGEPA